MSLCIVTAYNEAFAGVGNHAVTSISAYAMRYNTDYRVDLDPSCGRPPAWRKVQMIPEAFDRGYEWVLWIDADAIFRRLDRNIMEVVDDNHDLYMVRHDHPVHSPPPVPNTGVMLARNCGFCRDLFAELWSMNRYVDHNWWENAAMIKRMGFDSLLGEGPDQPDRELLSRIAFIGTEWNFCPSACHDEDPIIHHFAGLPLYERESGMAAIAARLSVESPT